MAVLGNVLLEAEAGKLILTTANLELRITTKIEAEIEMEGKTTIRTKKLFSLVSRFIGKKISMSRNEKHHTEIQWGTSNFTLSGLPADDFSGTKGDAIVPLKSANEVKRLMEKKGDVIVETGESQALFSTNSLIITPRLIVGNCPNYRQVIPWYSLKKWKSLLTEEKVNFKTKNSPVLKDFFQRHSIYFLEVIHEAAKIQVSQ